jgi:hypothetical protein
MVSFERKIFPHLDLTKTLNPVFGVKYWVKYSVASKFFNWGPSGSLALLIGGPLGPLARCIGCPRAPSLKHSRVDRLLN